MGDDNVGWPYTAEESVIPIEATDCTARAQTLLETLQLLHLQPPYDGGAKFEWTYKATRNQDKFPDHAFCSKPIKWTDVLSITRAANTGPSSPR